MTPRPFCIRERKRRVTRVTEAARKLVEMTQAVGNPLRAATARPSVIDSSLYLKEKYSLLRASRGVSALQ